MKLVEGRIKSFRSLQDTRISYGKYKGIVGIEGRTVGGGAVSNGAAKSAAFMDFAAWVLFGKPVTKPLTSDSVCNRRTGLAEGEIDIELASGRVITVFRSRKNGVGKLSVTGMTTGTNEGKQEALEKMLNLDHALWTRTVGFGGELSAFCRMSDSEKKGALERLLGLEQYGRAREAAVEKARDARGALELARSKLVSARENEEGLVATLKNLEEDEARFSKQYASELRTLNRERTSTLETLLDQLTQLSDLGAQVAEEESAFQAEVAAWKTRKIRLEKNLESARESASTTRETKAVTRERLKDAKAALKQALNNEHPDECPTCGQAWSQDRGTGQMIESHKLAVRDAEKSDAKATLEFDQYEEAITKARTAIENHAEAEPVPGGLHEKWENLKTIIETETEIALASRTSELKGVKAAKSENPYTDQLNAARDNVALTSVQLRQYGEAEAKAQTDLLICEYWSKGFGKQGIPSYLIDNSIPFLNDAAQRMASYLTDGETRIYFDPTAEGGREARGGQRIAVVVDNRNGGGTYEDQSVGEKARVDVCVLLAIRHLMAQRMSFGFDQLFVDEVFDGMDDEGINRVVRLLRTEFPTVTIFIITHNDTLKGLVDSTVVVRKKAGISTVIETP